MSATLKRVTLLPSYDGERTPPGRTPPAPQHHLLPVWQYPLSGRLL